MNSANNLTDKLDIRHAIERKGGGHGSMSRLARLLGLHRSVLSMNISGQRRQEKVLAGIADFLGQPVHGVSPSRMVGRAKKEIPVP